MKLAGVQVQPKYRTRITAEYLRQKDRLNSMSPHRHQTKRKSTVRFQQKEHMWCEVFYAFSRHKQVRHTEKQLFVRRGTQHLQQRAHRSQFGLYVLCSSRSEHVHTEESRQHEHRSVVEQKQMNSNTGIQVTDINRTSQSKYRLRPKAFYVQSKKNTSADLLSRRTYNLEYLCRALDLYTGSPGAAESLTVSGDNFNSNSHVTTVLMLYSKAWAPTTQKQHQRGVNQYKTILEKYPGIPINPFKLK